MTASTPHVPRCATHSRVPPTAAEVGDGVEEAFYTTDRVMTCSFHKFGDFFPGTGDIADIGESEGKGYAINVPLNDGLDDDSFRQIFRSTISDIMTYSCATGRTLRSHGIPTAGAGGGCN